MWELWLGKSSDRAVEHERIWIPNVESLWMIWMRKHEKLSMLNSWTSSIMTMTVYQRTKRNIEHKLRQNLMTFSENSHLHWQSSGNNVHYQSRAYYSRWSRTVWRSWDPIQITQQKLTPLIDSIIIRCNWVSKLNEVKKSPSHIKRVRHKYPNLLYAIINESTWKKLHQPWQFFI